MGFLPVAVFVKARSAGPGTGLVGDGHPDQWEAMHADPALIPAAIEEMIRWVTPLNNMFRVATVDSELGGTPIKAGDRMALLYPSANRDETVFDDPFRFDVRRHPNPQIAFGFGTHFCLGASLARLELRLLIERLVATITDLEVLRPPDIEPNIFVGAVRSLDLGFTRRSVPTSVVETFGMRAFSTADVVSAEDGSRR